MSWDISIHARNCLHSAALVLLPLAAIFCGVAIHYRVEKPVAKAAQRIVQYEK